MTRWISRWCEPSTTWDTLWARKQSARLWTARGVWPRCARSEWTSHKAIGFLLRVRSWQKCRQEWHVPGRIQPLIGPFLHRFLIPQAEGANHEYEHQFGTQNILAPAVGRL